MRIGTRRSALALAQAELVAGLLRAGPHVDCEIVPIATRGDRGASAEDKTRWVAELEQALLRGDIDVAVHSAKDVPGELVEGLSLLGCPERASAADVLCGAASLGDLGVGSRVGTSSIRRAAQLRAAREDLDVVAMRGNVDTRLRKLADAAEGLDAIVLARAGLERLGREAEIGAELDLERFVPAPGQGIIALEGRAGDERAQAAAAAITDAEAFACLLAERELAHGLQASCHTPLGAHAMLESDGSLRLRAWVGLPDGSAWAGDELSGELGQPTALAREVADRLRLAGAADLLREAERSGGPEHLATPELDVEQRKVGR
ncbi:MAG TPA: hydroxymethylbilane synthase [Solirubrobacteraceae bacterium]|jgi:hydroxymethylbilane synthase|nr:hydroxymethylbilane synthase [Solirubrobacteraceae bacterium]